MVPWWSQEISNPNSREALNRHSIKSFTPPLADHNIDSVALTLLSDSSRLGLRRRKEETHAGTHRADLISNSSFTARFGRGIPQATTPIWFVPHHGDPRRNHHVGTRQRWPQQNCLRAPSTRADTALPASRSALPCPGGPTGPAGQIPARPCPPGIRGLPEVRSPRTRLSPGALRQMPFRAACGVFLQEARILPQFGTLPLFAGKDSSPTALRQQGSQ